MMKKLWGGGRSNGPASRDLAVDEELKKSKAQKAKHAFIGEDPEAHALLLPIGGPEEENDLERLFKCDPSPGMASDVSVVENEDVVLFAASNFFAKESDGHVLVDVIRLGNLKGECSVGYQTKDGSAKAGSKYLATTGTLLFEDGKDIQRIDIPIMDSDAWCATTEFKVILNHAVSCTVGRHLHRCYVQIIDVNHFPSSKYEEKLREGPEGIEEISGIGLSLEYFKLVANLDGHRWRVAVTVIFDQLVKNAQLFLQLFLWGYIADVLFSKECESAEELFVQVGEIGECEEEHEIENWDASKVQTAGVVMLLYIVPMLFLHFWEFCKLQMDLEGRTRIYLQTNVFRRYLNYTSDSREKVPGAALQVAVIRYANMLAKGFDSMLDMAFIFGKIWVILYFISRENPDALKYEILMLVSGLVWGLLRYRICKYPPDTLSQENKIAGIIDDTCDKYRLIANYARKLHMNDEFEAQVAILKHMEHPEEQYELHSGYFYNWLGPVFIGLYIWMAAQKINDDKMELGTLLSTIVSFKEITEGFCEAHEIFEAAHTMVDPLRHFTILLNRETDVDECARINKRRRDTMRRARKHVQRGSADEDPINMLPIKFQDVNFTFGTGKVVLSGFTQSVAQGSLVAISGKHMTGKQTILRLLGQEISPSTGEIFVPTHLRLLHVSQESFMLKASLWDNLTFGVERHEDKDPERVKAVLVALQLWQALEASFHVPEDVLETSLKITTSIMDAEIEEEDESTHNDTCVCCCSGKPSHSSGHGGHSGHGDELSEDAWQGQLTYSMRLKLHLARALISSAEVLVMQRPLHHYSKEGGMEVLAVIKEHVKDRGLGFRAATRMKRRPRTVFFSAEAPEHIMESDQCWEIRGDEMEVTPIAGSKEQKEILRMHFARTRIGRTDHLVAADKHMLSKGPAG